MIDSKADIKSVIILGSYNEREECEELKNKIKIDTVVNYAGNATITQIYAILRNCRMFIGNDSGLMHLAVASELRVISLFGPTNDVVYGPDSDKNIVIRTKENYDYFKSLKINENKSYMKSIKPEIVVKNYEKIINDNFN